MVFLDSLLQGQHLHGRALSAAWLPCITPSTFNQMSSHLISSHFISPPSSHTSKSPPHTITQEIVQALLGVVESRSMEEHVLAFGALSHDILWDAPPALLQGRDSMRAMVG